MAFVTMVCPTHRWVSTRNVLFRTLIAMLLGVGLLFQMPKSEYEECGPWYTWCLKCCPKCL